jgi:hypothetical protein
MSKRPAEEVRVREDAPADSKTIEPMTDEENGSDSNSQSPHILLGGERNELLQ